MFIRNALFSALVVGAGLSTGSSSYSQDSLAPIERIFPPVGTKPDREKIAALRRSVEELERDLAAYKSGYQLYADVAIFPKAVRYALDYDEFYNPRDLDGAQKLLEVGRERLKELKPGVKEASWTKQHGLVVRGYISKIDNSVQPYGLHIPEGLDLSKPNPLYIWLHGRQEKILDLQFLLDRSKNKGKVAPDDAITLHPFGRYNNAFKFAGEQDVIDVMFHVEEQYKTDPARRVLMGFSMGGAGCWQIGSHYSNLFCAMSPGAGFVESRRFLHIKDDNLPPWYQQALWQWYDVPSYTRNLFNIPVIAYSGEKDRQKQAADVMEVEFKKYGRQLNHIIGPNMGHEYDDQSLKSILDQIKTITQSSVKPVDHRYIQSPLVTYANTKGISIGAQKQKWMPMELDAELATSQTSAKFSTKNIDQFSVSAVDVFGVPESAAHNAKLTIGETLFQSKSPTDYFRFDGNKWSQNSAQDQASSSPRLDRYEGSIDVAFCTPFLFVMPTGKSHDPQVEQWVQRESAYQIDRWRRTFRGDVQIVKDEDLSVQQERQFNLILWGDADSNSVIRKIAARAKARAEYGWGKVLQSNTDRGSVVVGIGPKRLFGEESVMNTISKGGFSEGRWFVLNSGPTFRDDHDKNNANQVPKLPDWAILDVSTPGDAKSAGRVIQAAFFGEHWEYEDPTSQEQRFAELLKSNL